MAITTERREYFANVIGKIWMPPVTGAKSDYKIETDSDENAIEQIYADGDFQAILDFQLYRKDMCDECPKHPHHFFTLVRNWDSDESNVKFWEMLGGTEEDDQD